MTDVTIADFGNACAGLSDDTITELKAIARLHDDAGGLMMTLANWAGDKAADMVKKLPADWQARVGEATDLALREAYRAASATQAASDKGFLDRALGWASGERWHMVATSVTGALGGAGGIVTTLADLPVTITLMLRSIQQIAAGYGEDVTDEVVRTQCLAVFALGGQMMPATPGSPARGWRYRARP